MPRSLLTPRRMLLIVAGLLLIASLLPVRYVSWVGDPAGNVVAAVLIPVRAPLAHLAVTVRRPADPELSVRDEHHPGQMVAYHRQLELQIDELQRQLHEFDRIRRVLGEDRQIHAVTARVVGPSGDRANPTLQINRGSRHGVRERQTVVTGFVLVGEVVRVGSVHADVRPFTFAERQLEVRLVPPREGPPDRQHQAWMQIQDRGERLIINAEPDDPIETGDWAHLADDRWGAEALGFLVAQVTDVRRDPDDPYQNKLVTLEPAIDLLRLRQVTVLTAVE